MSETEELAKSRKDFILQVENAVKTNWRKICGKFEPITFKISSSFGEEKKKEKKN